MTDTLRRGATRTAPGTATPMVADTETTIADAIEIIEQNANDLTLENIEDIFNVLEQQTKAQGIAAPWTPQAKRADMKLVAWLKDHGKPATYEEIAEGLSETFEGVTPEAVDQIVANDQQNKEKFRKFVLDGDLVSLALKKAKKTAVILKRK